MDHRLAYKIVHPNGNNGSMLGAGDLNGSWDSEGTIYGQSGRKGSTTRGKRKGVKYIIRVL